MASLNGKQHFYSAWDNNGLRLTWTRADWEQEGDLFLYLDSQAGGSSRAYNPYSATQNKTLIILPIHWEGLSNIDRMQADFLVWVQEDDQSTDGEPITYTLRFVNRGTMDAHGVTVDLNTKGRITLPQGERHSENGHEWYQQRVEVGSIAAGSERTITINSLTDFAFDPNHHPRWAKIDAVVYDDRGDAEHNQIELLNFDHELDEKGPRHIDIQTPTHIGASFGVFWLDS